MSLLYQSIAAVGYICACRFLMQVILITTPVLAENRLASEENDTMVSLKLRFYRFVFWCNVWMPISAISFPIQFRLAVHPSFADAVLFCAFQYMLWWYANHWFSPWDFSRMCVACRTLLPIYRILRSIDVQWFALQMHRNCLIEFDQVGNWYFDWPEVILEKVVLRR